MLLTLFVLPESSRKASSRAARLISQAPKMRILRYLLTWYISLIQSQCCTILVFIKARFVFTTLFTRGSNKCSTAKIHGPYLGRDIFTGTGAGKLAIWIYKLSYQSSVEVEVEIWEVSSSIICISSRLYVKYKFFEDQMCDPRISPWQILPKCGRRRKLYYLRVSAVLDVIRTFLLFVLW